MPLAAPSVERGHSRIVTSKPARTIVRMASARSALLVVFVLAAAGQGPGGGGGAGLRGGRAASVRLPWFLVLGGWLCLAVS